MVEPAKDRIRDNIFEPLDRARAGRVLPKRNVSSYLIIIGSVFRKNSPKCSGRTSGGDTENHLPYREAAVCYRLLNVGIHVIPGLRA
jgi:hypothetical protein